MNIILNERKLVEELLDKKDVSKEYSKHLYLLIKYYYLQGKDKGQVRLSIEQFMAEHYPKYNPVLWDKKITKLVDAGKRPKKSKSGEIIKRVLIEIDENLHNEG